MKNYQNLKEEMSVYANWTDNPRSFVFFFFSKAQISVILFYFLIVSSFIFLLIVICDSFSEKVFKIYLYNSIGNLKEKCRYRQLSSHKFITVYYSM